MHIELVEFDSIFWNKSVFPKLEYFYFNIALPELAAVLQPPQAMRLCSFNQWDAHKLSKVTLATGTETPLYFLDFCGEYIDTNGVDESVFSAVGL